MKFNDGNWMTKNGVKINNPKAVQDIKINENSLLLYAHCNHQNTRGDTLSGPLISINVTSPAENVIRVQAWHFSNDGEKQPNFKIADDHVNSIIEKSDNNVKFSSGSLNLKINIDNFGMMFLDEDRELTFEGSRGLAWIQDKDEKSYMQGQLNIGVGEQFYGLGERFTPFVKNGQSIDIWNKDGGTSSEQAYKNVPFYLSNKGYGVFVNHPENVSFEVGSEVVSKVNFSVEGEYLDYYFINGPTPKDVLGRYTALTGKPALPPAWSFGLWLSTSFTTKYDEQTVNHFVDGMLEREIPLSVFHFDCFWMKEMEWCNFEWDSENFPDPVGMLKRLKEKGLKICVWINPYIAQKSKLFDEAKKNGYLLKKINGEVWQWDLWQPGMGIVDFTNPQACEWFGDKLRELIDMGVDSFKTDFGERIPTNVIYSDGSDPERMHNYYSYLYNEVVFNVLKEKLGEKEAIVFARSATTGGQKYPVHWGGDCDSTYESMAESLRGGLSLTMSGFGYWSHDIGGFENKASPDVFKRWTAFGLMSSHSRLHGSSSYRVPWMFDEEAVEVTKYFARLKNKLMPYLYQAATENHHTGVPVMRAMILEFPDDAACETLDRQYMLGDTIMVAPIFNEKGMSHYYLPNGKWTHLLTGEVKKGGAWFKEYNNYFHMPLFVRENSILPIGANEDYADYDYAENVTFHLYEIADGAEISKSISDKNGELLGSITVKRRGEQLNIDHGLHQRKITLFLKGHSKIESVSDGVWNIEPNGVKIIPQMSSSFIVYL
ncbi:alpha-xylosidase [Salipaludibacillus neizhouensis]|uniref:alpha-D-xyloside xylohydrolase n=1 Tax=Salipaludibacillus neizhouensis TaxID=885475 RepID=A0A3A9K6B0_9BACI|nr:alpha-xylosidase [Salipaludibacillus neizhouensis]RKL68117.1 alpha-xylosidase [Salipaludibacillus neizhouensis]